MPPKKKVKTEKGAKAVRSQDMEECLSLLKQFAAKPDASAFLEPVDWEFYGLEDYPEVIKNPMDLGTVQKKLEAGEYTTPDEFAVDVHLVWGNAMTYNRADSEIYKVSDKFDKGFAKKFSKISSKANSNTNSTTKRKKPDTTKEVSKQDRIKFCKFVTQIMSDELEKLVLKIQEKSPEAMTEEEESDGSTSIEIEITSIDGSTLLHLNEFMNKCLQKRKKA